MIIPVKIIDNYSWHWLLDLGDRFCQSQIWATMKVNREMLKLYWDLGKDITYFKHILPASGYNLTKESTCTLYGFAFMGLTYEDNKRKLIDALLLNITQPLMKFDTDCAQIGKEYCLQIEKTENILDLLFYNLKLWKAEQNNPYNRPADMPSERQCFGPIFFRIE